MAKDILGEAGLHFDELNKLRVLDPEVAQQTTELKEECRLFVDKIAEFKKIVGNLIELVDQLAKATENEKIKAIGARNLLKSIAKQREAQQQQLQALITEKKTQLESIGNYARCCRNLLDPQVPSGVSNTVQNRSGPE